MILNGPLRTDVSLARFSLLPVWTNTRSLTLNSCSLKFQSPLVRLETSQWIERGRSSIVLEVAAISQFAWNDVRLFTVHQVGRCEAGARMTCSIVFANELLDYSDPRSVSAVSVRCFHFSPIAIDERLTQTRRSASYRVRPWTLSAPSHSDQCTDQPLRRRCCCWRWARWTLSWSLSCRYTNPGKSRRTFWSGWPEYEGISSLSSCRRSHRQCRSIEFGTAWLVGFDSRPRSLGLTVLFVRQSRHFV